MHKEDFLNITLLNYSFDYPKKRMQGGVLNIKDVINYCRKRETLPITLLDKMEEFFRSRVSKKDSL
jgi:hypothetical protein